MFVFPDVIIISYLNINVFFFVVIFNAVADAVVKHVIDAALLYQMNYYCSLGLGTQGFSHYIVTTSIVR